MSCPDWGALLAHRRRLRGREPEGLRGALEHLAACPACRRRALRVDPTLVFRLLPPEEPADGEIEAVRRNVRALRRTLELESAPPRRRRVSGGMAAAFLLALLFLMPVPGADPGREPPPGRGAGEWQGQILRGPISLPAGSAPLVESLDRPLARVYHLGGEDLSVVMIVDETLDV